MGRVEGPKKEGRRERERERERELEGRGGGVVKGRNSLVAVQLSRLTSPSDRAMMSAESSSLDRCVKWQW